MKLKSITINLFLLIFFNLFGCKSISNRNNNDLIPIPYYLNKKSDSQLGIESIDNFISKKKVNKNNQIIEIEDIYDENYENIVSNEIHPINMNPLFNHYFSKNKTIGSEEVEIVNGYPNGIYSVRVLKSESFFTLKKINYTNKHLSGELIINNLKDSLLYKTIFKKGTDYWKDYYYKESKIREEGNVKNNYKIGLWKYYNLSGKIDSTKTYTLKDAVDVRYPYCFFNKNEPCY